jgi:hypothetical protein
VPASHVHTYELPPASRLLVGTVLPSYGQAGGGVEVKLPAATAATAFAHPTLDDF